MFRRHGSPVAVACAGALAFATLFAGAWELGGHGHEAAMGNVDYCAVDHDAESPARSGHESVGQAAAFHEHSCATCTLGRSQAHDRRWKARIGALDRVSAEPWPGKGDSPRNGDSWRHRARGPPRS